MLTPVARSAVRTVAPRVFKTLGKPRHMSSLGDTFEKKGRVEEDRFVRAQDAANLGNIHKMMVEQAQAAASANADSQFEQHVKPVMDDIKSLLDSADSLSDASLEHIARWKLGL